jgi:beta-hydroxylase
MSQQQFIDNLVNNVDQLIEEYQHNKAQGRKTFALPDWSPESVPVQEWQAVALWWKYKPWAVYQKWYPFTTSLVKDGPTHRATGHLILKPQSKTPKHRHLDWGNKIILHIPLIIPKGDVGFWIDGKIHRWKVGEAFAFDITKEHYGFNNTDQERVLLVMEFDAELWGDTLRQYQTLD